MRNRERPGPSENQANPEHVLYDLLPQQIYSE